MLNVSTTHRLFSYWLYYCWLFYRALRVLHSTELLLRLISMFNILQSACVLFIKMMLKTCTYQENKIVRISLSLQSSRSKYTMLNDVIRYRIIRVYHTLKHLFYILLSHQFLNSMLLISHWHQLLHSYCLLIQSLTQLFQLLHHYCLLIQSLTQLFQLMFGIILSSSRKLCSKRRWRHAAAAMNIDFRWNWEMTSVLIALRISKILSYLVISIA